MLLAMPGKQCMARSMFAASKQLPNTQLIVLHPIVATYVHIEEWRDTIYAHPGQEKLVIGC